MIVRRDRRGLVVHDGTTALRVAPVAPAALARRAARLAQAAAEGGRTRAGLLAALRSVDLTSLQGADTPGSVRALCARALRPDPDDPRVPPVAAVCVYPARVADAVAALDGAPVRVASVAGGFPSGLTPRAARIAEIRAAVAAGAHEVDIVLDRGALLSGRPEEAAAEVVAGVAAAAGAHVKTILEAGELGSLAAVRLAAVLALAAGSDVVKTSTGTIPAGASAAITLCMAEAVRDVREATGRDVGLKVAGGIRTAGQALGLMAIVEAVLGADGLDPRRFRIGASALLGDLVAGLRAPGGVPA